MLADLLERQPSTTSNLENELRTKLAHRLFESLFAGMLRSLMKTSISSLRKRSKVFFFPDHKRTHGNFPLHAASRIVCGFSCNNSATCSDVNSSSLTFASFHKTRRTVAIAGW